jgi:hypothetical protein
MKKRKLFSYFFYSILGFIALSCFVYYFFLSERIPQNPLALRANAPEKLVSLKGCLTLKLFPGPPEYSSIEDGDREDYCWILKLDEASFLTAITTPVAEPANDLNRIVKRLHPDEVMLVLDEHLEEFCQKYQNCEIESLGYLFHAHTIHHCTPILIDVKELKLVEVR